MYPASLTQMSAVPTPHTVLPNTLPRTTRRARRQKTHTCRSTSSYLVLQIFDDGEVACVVGADDRFALVIMSDLHLQVVVLLLQGAHLLQVGGQAVVQVLHGGLLVGPDVEVHAGGHVEASGGGQGGVSVALLGRGDTSATAACSSVDTRGPLAVGYAAERHAESWIWICNREDQ